VKKWNKNSIAQVKSIFANFALALPILVLIEAAESSIDVGNTLKLDSQPMILVAQK
jgi:hypothetical protein